MYEWVGLASVEIFPSQKSQKYHIICHSDFSDEKSIHCIVSAFFKLVVILALWGFGFNINFFEVEYFFQLVVTTVKVTL